jgi:alkanesulfonate monooxygenase SsuD/methylene tetrahydromethanopterin reductase-like flavin-dependent oxidoreductase (luciferase family)
VTSVLVLPQRSTPLVAKQAAEVDLPSSGRLRLAVGVGGNVAEYASLNADVETRNRRPEEQIAALRKLWTEPLATFKERGTTSIASHVLRRVARSWWRRDGTPARWVSTYLRLGAGRGIPGMQQLETSVRMKRALTGVL